MVKGGSMVKGFHVEDKIERKEKEDGEETSLKKKQSEGSGKDLWGKIWQ